MVNNSYITSYAGSKAFDPISSPYAPRHWAWFCSQHHVTWGFQVLRKKTGKTPPNLNYVQKVGHPELSIGISVLSQERSMFAMRMWLNVMGYITIQFKLRIAAGDRAYPLKHNHDIPLFDEFWWLCYLHMYFLDFHHALMPHQKVNNHQPSKTTHKTQRFPKKKTSSGTLWMIF